MYKNKFTPIILPIIIIVIWYLITSVLHLVTSYTLPSPIDVCISAWDIIQSGELFRDSFDTLFKVFAGMAIASIVAIPLGRIICKKINKNSKGMNILFDCILVLAFWAVSLIPFVGGLVTLIINLLAFGIITYAIFFSKKLNETTTVEVKKDDSEK